MQKQSYSLVLKFSPHHTTQYVEFRGGVIMKTGEALYPLPTVDRITIFPKTSIGTIKISGTRRQQSTSSY